MRSIPFRCVSPLVVLTTLGLSSASVSGVARDRPAELGIEEQERICNGWRGALQYEAAHELHGSWVAEVRMGTADRWMIQWERATARLHARPLRYFQQRSFPAHDRSLQLPEGTLAAHVRAGRHRGGKALLVCSVSPAGELHRLVIPYARDPRSGKKDFLQHQGIGATLDPGPPSR